MIKVLTCNEMKTLDYYTCEKKAISSLQLMEIAGKKLFNCLKEKVNIDQSNFEILIVAGLGNNGGDALVVSEHLINDNFNVKIVVIGDLNNLTPETRSVYNRINNNNTSIINITCESDIKLFYKLVNKANVIVDGIFGIGLDRDINGIFYECIRIINESKNFVFSIDIPSGIYGSSGNIAKIAVMANFTAIIQNYKIGNLLNDAKDYHGKLEVLDIGVLQDTNKSNKYLLTLLDVDKLLPKRKENTHKYNYGSSLVIGGNIGMTGAPLLSAYAALRCGIGLSSIGIYNKYYHYLNNIYPELMVFPYQNISDFIKLLKPKNSLAFGPGLGRNETIYYELLDKLLEEKIPLVIDADGIFYLKELLHKINIENKVIITPHLGEIALLLDTEIELIKQNPLEAVKYLIDMYGFTVILKGPCTIIGNKAAIYFCNLGNAGMATAGSGDVLTGIITSFIGQGLDLLDAAKLGVYLHSSAGDVAYKKYGNALIATDIIECLPLTRKTICRE